MRYSEKSMEVSRKDSISSLDGKYVVVVVVGNEAESKSRIADVLARKMFGTSTQTETTAAGVRIISSESNEAVVVDTLPFFGESFSERAWISQNSLRRLVFGKFVLVVCVATAQEGSRGGGGHNLFHVSPINDTINATLSLFKTDTHAVKILVNEVDVGSVTKFLIKENITKYEPRDVYKFFTKRFEFSSPKFHDANYAFVDLLTEGESVAISIVDQIINRPAHHAAIQPTLMLERRASTKDIKKWDPERVILFGRSGGGKSTLAQMLTTGKLNPLSESFRYSSSITGETRDVVTGEGRGWYVVDTPGFGEPNDNRQTHSTISTEAAQAKITEYVQSFEGIYAHYLYVTKKDRFDKLEKLLWDFFLELFKDSRSANCLIASHFSVVISGADESWMEKEREKLEGFFGSCKSFLCADFPDVNEHDPELEEEDRAVREGSLKDLENNLAKLGRKDTICDLGSFSELRCNQIQKALYNLPAGILIAKVAGPAIIRATNLLFKDKKLVLQPEL